MGIAMSRTIVETSNHCLIRMLFLLNVECREINVFVTGRGEGS
jgi:hypothetical protein